MSVNWWNAYTDEELLAAARQEARSYLSDLVEASMWRWMNGDCESFDALRERIGRISQEPDA